MNSARWLFLGLLIGFLAVSWAARIIFSRKASDKVMEKKNVKEDK